MISGLHHVGVVVESADAALSLWRDLLGLSVSADTVLEAEGVRVVVLPKGEHEIRLIEPLLKDTGAGRYRAQRGERLHHLCFRTDDIEADCARLSGLGMEFIDRAPRNGLGGRVALLHPKSTHNILVELLEPPARTPISDELGIEHLGMLMTNYESATKTWVDVFGLSVVRERDEPYREAHRQFTMCGRTMVEILTPTSDSPDSRYRRRLARDGEGMISMISLEVTDLDAELARLRAAGIEVPDPAVPPGGRRGATTDRTFGIYLQLVQPAPGRAGGWRPEDLEAPAEP